MTWRKLGYGFYSDSLSYRQVLDNNPRWSVVELPPSGTVLVGGTTISGAGSSQQSPVFGRSSGQEVLDFYPFLSEEEYYLSLSSYSRSSLREVSRLNGWSTDSSEVVTGLVG